MPPQYEEAKESKVQTVAALRNSIKSVSTLCAFIHVGCALCNSITSHQTVAALRTFITLGIPVQMVPACLSSGPHLCSLGNWSNYICVSPHESRACIVAQVTTVLKIVGLSFVRILG